MFKWFKRLFGSSEKPSLRPEIEVQRIPAGIQVYASNLPKGASWELMIKAQYPSDDGPEYVKVSDITGKLVILHSRETHINLQGAISLKARYDNGPSGRPRYLHAVN